MENERVQKNESIKRSNTCAAIGFLLTLLNIAVSIILIVTENYGTLMIFASITALVSLALCIVGVSNANRAGKGKVMGVLGIILNVLILLAVAFFLIFLLLFIQSCSNVQIKF